MKNDLIMYTHTQWVYIMRIVPLVSVSTVSFNKKSIYSIYCLSIQLKHDLVKYKIDLLLRPSGLLLVIY